MTRVLVTYASKHGATAEIAEAIAQELGSQDLQTDCRPAGDVKSLDDYGAVVLGSAVYMKRWQPDARKLLRKHADELAARPFWLFSSGPLGEHPDLSWAEPARTVAAADRLGARGHVVFGGRLPLDPSGFVEKAMVRNTPDEVSDLRDWDEVRSWAQQIARSLNATAARTTTSS